MTIYAEPRLLPCGDRALSVELADEIGRDVTSRVLALDYLIRADGRPGHRRDGAELPRAPRLLRSARDRVCRARDAIDRAGRAGARGRPAARRGPSSCRAATTASSASSSRPRPRGSGSPPEEVARLHAGAAYYVDFIGFTPGLPYLSGLPERLHIPRLEHAARQDAAGQRRASAACSAASTRWRARAASGCSGGRRCRSTIPSAADPILLRAGDHVRFRAIDRAEFDAITAEVAAGNYRPVIEEAAPAPEDPQSAAACLL